MLRFFLHLAVNDPARQHSRSQTHTSSWFLQFAVEELVGAHGMINYVDARTSWMDDIVKQAQWQGITQVDRTLPVYPITMITQPAASCSALFLAPQHML